MKIIATPTPVSRLQTSSLHHVFLYNKTKNKGFTCTPWVAQFPLNFILSSNPSPLPISLTHVFPPIWHMLPDLLIAQCWMHRSVLCKQYTIGVSPLWMLIFYETCKNVLSLKLLCLLNKGSQNPWRDAPCVPLGRKGGNEIISWRANTNISSVTFVDEALHLFIVPTL